MITNFELKGKETGNVCGLFQGAMPAFN